MKAAPLLVLALALAGCCSAPKEEVFPDLGPLTDEQALAIIHSRTEAVRSLQAVLSVTYESKDFNGTFSAVCNYEAPGKIRFTAFKDLVVSTQPIFDVLFTPSEYAIEVAAMRGEKAVHDRGKIAHFPEKHPRFASLYWAGEALFLPGKLKEPRIVPEGEWCWGVPKLTVRGKLASGTDASAVFRRSNLDPYSTDVRDLSLTYENWERRKDAVLPRLVWLHAPTEGTDTTCTLEQLEVNVPLDAAIFSPDSVGEGK